MATLDIFNNDAFSVSQLTQSIIDIPRVPTQLGDQGLFREYGITTTTMMIERTGSGLKLVPVAPRGGVGATVGRDKRKMIPIAAAHLPQRDTILADEIQNVRAFGSETEVEGMQRLVSNQLAKLKANLDLTLEHMRVGALRGEVLDADGVSVVWNLYDLFGMNRQSMGFNINTAGTTVDLRQKTEDLKRAIQRKLGGKSFTRVRVKCSEQWFDKFVGHDKMYKAWERYQDGAFNRDFPGQTFLFNNVLFEVYSGFVVDGQGNEVPFIPAGKAYAYPEGVPGMFQIAYAPGDYASTVNTLGVPYYASQERLPHDKGVDLESQSNPIVLNSLPEAVIELTTSAS
ncbi:major capsid protein [Comamonas sp.]|uniref:major capsid protein n=1 Tax=Comamonas sp. TaxID=34028 RepID=UPI0028A9AD29|nr:major capsid protein [Comamonas sp.]